MEARRARVLRHTYAPRLEAFREIQRLPEVVSEAAPEMVGPGHLNLRLVRGARRTKVA